MRTLVVVAAAVLLGGCAESSGSLGSRVDDNAGVVAVEVRENDGDNDIPFATVPKSVTVRMEADVSADQVLAVFDAYDDPIDDGDVRSVEVVLVGTKHATLSAGEGIHVGREPIEDLVAAQADDAVVEYRREAHPVLPGVSAELRPTGFADVTAYADRYVDTEDVESVEVVAGPFLLVRDEVNADPRVTAAREDLAHLVDERFGLLGAVVTGRSPLELTVALADEDAVRRLVGARAGADVGRVRVRTAS